MKDLLKLYLIFAISLFIVTSCSDKSSTPTSTEEEPDPIEKDEPVSSKTIDESGGTIQITANDGTKYSLIIPPRALSSTVKITLTPLASAEDFPFASGPSTGLLMEPDGLQFYTPAALTISTANPMAGGFVGFSQSDNSFQIIPAWSDTNVISLDVAHFSSVGTSQPTAEEAESVAPPASDALARARHEIAMELSRASAAGEHPNANTLEQIFTDWYQNGVKTSLESVTNSSSGSKSELDAVLREWLQWQSEISRLAEVEIAMAGLLAESRSLAQGAIQSTIDALNSVCIEEQNKEYISKIINVAGIAAMLGLDTEESGLTLDQVIADLCMQVVITSAEVPEPFENGATLEVIAGLSFGGNDPVFDTSLEIILQSSDSNLTPASGQTDSEGRFESDVELTSDNEGAIIEITAIYPELEDLQATTELVIERPEPKIELLVDGSDSATLETEDSAFLDIFLTWGDQGVTGGAVSLQVNGSGTLNSQSARINNGVANAVYTTPNHAASEQIIASFNFDGKTISDTVSVEVIEVPKGVVSVYDAYVAYGAGVTAHQNKYESDSESRDDYSTDIGVFSGAESVSATSGSATSYSSVNHFSEIKETSNENVNILLSIVAEGSVMGQVSASVEEQAGATANAGSEVHMYFEVTEAPVYFSIEATGYVFNGGSEIIMKADGDNSIKFHQDWSSEADSAKYSGELSPGIYSFDAGLSIMLGAGQNSTENLSFNSGEGEYSFEFFIYAKRPDQENR